MDDSHLNLQTLLSPLTKDEETQAKWAEVTQLLEALALSEEEYLAFLQNTQHLLQDLLKNEQAVKDEVGKLAARKKLSANP
jgi:hypothetical protein